MVNERLPVVASVGSGFARAIVVVLAAIACGGTVTPVEPSPPVVTDPPVSATALAKAAPTPPPATAPAGPAGSSADPAAAAGTPLPTPVSGPQPTPVSTAPPPTPGPTPTPAPPPTPVPTVGPTPTPAPTPPPTPGPTPTPAPTPFNPAAVGSGYSFLEVPTSRGTFAVHLIKERLSQVTVRTISSNATTCQNDCPVKPLAQYVSENGAYAGMNGTYFCPPDYATCAGKINSYDYAFYNSSLRRWINEPALVGQNGLVTFGGSSPTFYRRSYVYAQGPAKSAPISAGTTSFPLLLQNGAVIDSEAEQSDVQKRPGYRGSIGVDGTFVYLTLVTGASITDSAHVLRALGVTNALNLDGGGSSAMHFGGSYKVGPGRHLPNAVLLTRP